MTLDLSQAVAYDIECLPNCFLLSAEQLYTDATVTFEISEFRDDRAYLFEWMRWLHTNRVPMVSFNGNAYDYPMLHNIFHNDRITYGEIYDKNQAIFNSGDNRFGHLIWPRDHFAPQIDLFMVHHFNNKAKTTSLKALQVNMRSDTVVDSPIPFGQPITREQIETDLIPYNLHDVKRTKEFAFHSMDAIQFRVGLIDQFGIEVLNYNDVKIGVKMLEQRLGDDVCYDRSSGRKVMRQTPRTRIPLNDIIFPYLRFDNPEFIRVMDYMRGQVLTPDDLDDPDALIKTKGVFTGLVAHVGGLEWEFGTGGVHASVKAQRFTATEEWLIRDIDVKALYPSIAIVNKLAPEHLGQFFTVEYAKIPEERGMHKKGTYMNGALKLAANGPWGQSNNKYSIFFDPKYAMTIPVNGQLMICMLAEKLVLVPTLQIIQANTDGITYRIHRDYEPQAAAICKQWEQYTCLVLEDANYSRMWIRDVNNYIAEPVVPYGKNTPPEYKQKGAYWHPDPLDYHNSISTASPPCWYKDLSNIVSTRAAIAAMVHGIDPEHFIRAHSDKFDFMCRAKVDRTSTLLLGGRELQRTSRYYVAINGEQMTKVSPPAGPDGQYKRKNGITAAEYTRVMTANNWQWSEAVCTGKASKPDTWGKYAERRTNIASGWKVAECNDVRSFDFRNIDYGFYVAEARKLIIA